MTTSRSAPSQCKQELLFYREAAGNYGRDLIVGTCWGWRQHPKRERQRGQGGSLDGGDRCVGWETGVL